MAPNVRPITDLPWTLLSQSGSMVLLQVGGNTAGLVMQGVPPFRLEAHDVAAVAATLSGDEITVDFGIVPNPGEAVTLLSAQPGIRGFLGAYLAAGRQLLPLPPPLPPPPVATVDWTASILSALEVELVPVTGDCSQMLVTPAGFELKVGMISVTQVRISPASVIVGCASTFSSGNSITVFDLMLLAGTGSQVVLLPRTQDVF